MVIASGVTSGLAVVGILDLLINKTQHHFNEILHPARDTGIRLARQLGHTKKHDKTKNA